MIDDFLIIAPLFKLGYGAAALLAAVYFTRWLDRRSGFPFGETAKIIRRSALASSIYYGLRIGAALIAVAILMGCAPVQAGPLIPSKYDRQIEAAVAKWWPAYPFASAWKAQLFQESRLDPAAVSPVGAAGLAQFMPGTWAQISRELRLPPGLSPHHAWAIEAGAYYMAKLRGQWTAPRPAEDRHQLAQASYNAGLGHLLAAQKRCGGPPGYEDIITCLPQVTGRHSAETITYVRRIAHWRRLIEAGG